MRKTVFAAAAVAAFLSLGVPTNQAAAMTVATPSALGVTAADASPVQQVRWGWHRHPYWGWRHRYWGWRPYYWRPYYWRPYYWGGPWYGPRPWVHYYWVRPWGPCCWWGWHRPWYYW